MIDITKKHRYKMNLCCIKCSRFANDKDTKIKLKIDGKINLYASCISCDFKKFENNDEEE